ncbi:MAG TPA: hypothetical protein VF392_00505 [Terracidiphilus sp.]
MRNMNFGFALLLFSGAALLTAETYTGTVTNKTTSRPSQGDTVTLVSVQAGMSDAATATTDTAGHYSLAASGAGAYLIRVNHQGATYFIAAPQGGASGDLSVYDVAAKVEGVGLDADMILLEAAGGVLRVQERFLVRNTSLPPRAQFSDKTFEVVLPDDAELDGASATRPGGLGTTTNLTPLPGKGHYTFNIPIQPSKAEKETLFEVQYHISYRGSYVFVPHPQMPADHLVVYLAPGIDFSKAQGATFQKTQEDPRVQTYVARNVQPGQNIAFTVSGEGQMARDPQAAGQPAGMGGEAVGTPGGGIGAPIGSPDPLTRYKWWILSILGLTLAGFAAFFLRRKQPAQFDPEAADAASRAVAHIPARAASTAASESRQQPAAGPSHILQAIKDEFFAIEQDKLTGTISADEYANLKAGLGALLKRHLKSPRE